MEIKIGFTGADSTGKSTVIEEICRSFSEKYRIATLSVGDIARNSPYPLVDRQNIHSSNWILEQVQSNELSLQRKAEILICDRTSLDIWIFSSLAASLGHISDDQLNSFSFHIRQALKSYDVIFYSIIDNKIPIKIENLPSSDVRIRETFEKVLLASIELFWSETRFIQLPSSLENRVNLFSSTLKSLDIR